MTELENCIINKDKYYSEEKIIGLIEDGKTDRGQTEMPRHNSSYCNFENGQCDNSYVMLPCRLITSFQGLHMLNALITGYFGNDWRLK